MKKILDARKKQCPIPIIMAKDAMKEVDVIEIIVDNEIAMQNLYKLAKQKNYQIQSEKKDNDYIVNLIKGSHVVRKNEKVVVISNEVMGGNDEKLGKVLMKGFIYALSQLDILPSCLLFYNGGVKLTCKNSDVLEDLKNLETMGVEILSCGTCLSHYQLNDDLQVGKVTNMYEIVEKQMLASGVIYP